MKSIKTLSLLLAVLMALSSFTISAFALEIEDASEDGTTEETAAAAVTWEDVIAGMATPEEYCEANGVSDLSTELGGEASTTSTATMTEGTYYLNNRYTGKYLSYTSSSGASGSSGTLSALGTSIQWELVAASGGYYLRSVSDSTKYLGVPSGTTSSSSVEIVTVTSGTAPGRCLWAFSLSSVGGMTLQNDYNDRYLYSSGTSLYTKASLGTSGTAAYYNCVWRTVMTSYYSNSGSTTYRELKASDSFNELIVSVGSTQKPSIKKKSTTAMWSNEYDFTYTYSSGTKQCVTIASLTGIATGVKFGSTVFTATHKVTGRTYTLTTWVDRYYYELINTFKFSSGNASTVRNFYSYVEEAYSSKSDAEIAYIYSRLLGGLFYDDDNNEESYGEAWSLLAGSVYSSSTTELEYFANVLGYGGSSYAALKDAIYKQHNNAESLGGADFAHFQISISGRLAYLLGHQASGLTSSLKKLGLISSSTISSEELSYFTGWLGDSAFILNVSMKNDDYCADLDAENVYQYIASGSSIISAINKYYTKLSSKSRATIFLSYIDYPTVQSKISSYLGITNISHLESLYPDAYNFLYSLYNEESEMKDYTS